MKDECFIIFQSGSFRLKEDILTCHKSVTLLLVSRVWRDCMGGDGRSSEKINQSFAMEYKELSGVVCN
jgi:hypothetical protein